MQIIVQHEHKQVERKNTRIRLCVEARRLVILNGDGVIEKDTIDTKTPLYLHLLICASCTVEVMKKESLHGLYK